MIITKPKLGFKAIAAVGAIDRKGNVVTFDLNVRLLNQRRQVLTLPSRTSNYKKCVKEDLHIPRQSQSSLQLESTRILRVE